MVTSLPTATKIPKYSQLATALRDDIARGILKPGDRLPSFLEMRRRFGATQHTADKVFLLLEKDGLAVREPNRGIFVASPHILIPKKTPKTRTGLLGVSGWGFFSHTYAAYWSAILSGIREATSKAGVQILLLDPSSNLGWEKADGVLVCDYSAQEIFSNAAPSQPRVSVLVDLPQMATVAADDYSGGRLAARHLLELGHRKIAFLHGGDLNVVPQRMSGYRDALLEAGIAPQNRWARSLVGLVHDSEEFRVAGRETVENWLKSDWEEVGCTAIFCHNDATAWGAIEALENSGLRVPDDVSVVGFDGAETASRDLTTIRVPLHEIGACSVKVLLRQIEADQISNEHRVEAVTLKIGATSAPATF